MQFLRTLSLFFATLCLAMHTCHAEYLIYHVISGKPAPLSGVKDHAKIYPVLMTHQFPMNANPASHDDQKISSQEKDLLASNELLSLEHILQHHIHKDLHLLWIPETVYEHICINYFIQTNDEEIRKLFDILRSFKEEDCFTDDKLATYKAWNKVPGAKPKWFHCGFPELYDPFCKTSPQEYYEACNVLNRLPIFMQAHYLINRELFSCLQQNGYTFEPTEKIMPKSFALSVLETKSDAISNIPYTTNANKKDTDAYETIDDIIAFIQNVDTTLKPLFHQILDIEYDAHACNAFVLYRGTNGIGNKLDSPVVCITGNDGAKTYESRTLSFGRGLYAAALADSGACAARYFQECTTGYALLVDKHTYQKNSLTDHTMNLVHINPYNTIVSLFGYSKTCHPRAKSFTTIHDENFTIAYSPLFPVLFELNIIPDQCEALFDRYCSKNVRIIKTIKRDSF